MSVSLPLQPGLRSSAGSVEGGGKEVAPTMSCEGGSGLFSHKLPDVTALVRVSAVASRSFWEPRVEVWGSLCSVGSAPGLGCGGLIWREAGAGPCAGSNATAVAGRSGVRPGSRRRAALRGGRGSCVSGKACGQAAQPLAGR